jgi:hypothetical protein
VTQFADISGLLIKCEATSECIEMPTPEMQQLSRALFSNLIEATRELNGRYRATSPPQFNLHARSTVTTK